MKNKIIVAWMLAGILATTGVQAQDKKPTRTKTTREQSAQSSASGNTSLSIDRKSDDEVEHINYRKDGNEYKAWMLHGKIVDLYLNNKKVDEADYPKYESMFNELLAKARKDREQAARHRLQAQEDRRDAEQHRREAERDRRFAERDRERADRDRNNLDRAREQNERNRERAERDRERTGRYRDRLEQDRERAEADRDHMAHERARLQDERLRIDRDRREAEHERREAERARRDVERDRQRAQMERHRASEDLARTERNKRQAEQNRDRAERNRERAEAHRQRAEEHRQMLNGLMDELVNAKVVSSRDEVRTVDLTDESLIVNGQKQPAGLHRQLKDKYLKNPGSRINYEHSSDGTRMHIDREN